MTPIVLLKARAIRWALPRPNVEGAVGVYLGADLRERTTYTVSLWTSEAELRKWLTSPAHLRLMRKYRGRMESSSAIGFGAAMGVGRAAIYRDGMRRLLEHGE